MHRHASQHFAGVDNKLDSQTKRSFKNISTPYDESFQISERTYRLFAIFCLLIAIPISISISPIEVSVLSFIFILMIGNTLLDVSHRLPKMHLFLSGWSHVFFTAIALSLFLTSLTRRNTVTNGDFISLVYIAYWLGVFNMTAWLVSHMSLFWIQRITMLLGISVFFLGCIRFLESGLQGEWGLEITTTFLSKNEYGVYFSTLSLFILTLPIMLKGWKQRVSLVAALILTVIILGNSSRSSWLAIAIGFSLFMMIFLFNRRGIKAIKNIFYLVSIILAVVILINYAPVTFRHEITRALDSLGTVENDASYVTRQVLIEKSISLFNENPVFGVGLGYFTETQVKFENIPLLLNRVLGDASTWLNRKSAHNAYMGLLAETGLVGVIPFAVLLAVLALKGLNSVIILIKRQELWAISLYASFTSMSIHLWVLSGLWTTSTWFIYGLMAGMILRSIRLEEKECA